MYNLTNTLNGRQNSSYWYAS